MPIRLSDALVWRLDGVESQLTAVRAGITTTNDVADRLRDDAERTLDAMSGQSIESALRTFQDLRRRTFALGDDLRSAVSLLSSFARTSAFHQDRLRADVEAVHRMSGSVAEDGTVTPAVVSEPASPEDLDELEESIKATLRALDSLDLETSEKLANLHGSIADYGNNFDARTAIAGVVTSTMTQPLGGLIAADDDGLRGTRLVAKGLGPFGSALGFVSGLYGAPDDEPIRETLAAEGGGLAAGVAGGVAGGVFGAAAAGAIAGSVVPGLGTVVGTLGGLVIGGVASNVTSTLIRDAFDDRRDVG